MDASAAASAAAPAASTVTSSGVFPATPARGAAGAPASTAEAAASAAAIPPDGVRGAVAARRGVSSAPPVDWTTALHDQTPETAMTQRRRYQVIPAVTRSGSRRTATGAFALLEAEDKMVRSLATRQEADGDPDLPAALACDWETPETYAQAHAGPHGRIWGAAERKEFAGLTAKGTFKPAGVSVWRP